MNTDNFRTGLISLKINADVYYCHGEFTYNKGSPKREARLAGNGQVVGYVEKPQVPYIEGEILDHRELDLDQLVNITNSTVTLSLSSGKVIVLHSAWWAGEGTVHTEQGNIQARFEGTSCEEVR